ncbi:uncharacterized protein J8A68_002643 [[Candida] subhashii]|uniref:Uncharacterized protein n=1 Tax=[Candida] subhashii TaxID=561895 RepID=A0A8J5UIN0_9ASCO|nr:uncharacterized protein J8A68_002643 [[Candida] subhashii]KAG7663783.1 hypothetical protein J8A68_002643 [[Candida] subhashii]
MTSPAMNVPESSTKTNIQSPVNAASTASDFAAILLHRYFPLHGLPDPIQSHRGTQFTSATFQKLMDILRVKSTISVTNH